MKAKRSSSPVNKRNLRIQITKPNYSDEKRKSPRNLNLNNKAKPVETQQKPTSGKKKSSGSSTTNPTEVEDNATNPQEILIDKIATAKADTLKFILNDLNGKIVSASSQISE